MDIWRCTNTFVRLEYVYFDRIQATLLIHILQHTLLLGKDIGFTALNNAAQYGQMEVVKVLVENGARLSHASMTNTALHSAVYGGQAGITK